jgi:hypothetical protein
MANRYVYSGAAGTGTGADWTNAHTTLAAAITASTAGDTFFVAHDHNETTAASVTLTFKGSAATPDRVLCVNRAGSVPPVDADLVSAPSGQVEATGTSTLLVNGSFRCHGIIWRARATSTAAQLSICLGSGNVQRHEKCQFVLSTTSTSSRITFGADPATCTIVDANLLFSATGQQVVVTGLTIIGSNGTTLVNGSGSIPTTLFTSLTRPFVVRGADLSNLGSGKTITAAPARNSTTQLINCKLNSAVTISSASASPDRILDVIGCHSTTNAERNERYHFCGTLTTETTIVRTGGATDGAIPFSHKVVSNSSNRFDFPFEAFDGAIWNDATGSAKTLTVHVITDNVTLTDADIWLEVEYLGSGAAPISALATDSAATVLTAGANQAASTETWTTTGLTTPVKQKLDVTFTPQMAGAIRWRVKLAKASTTVYICPKAELV